MVDWNLRREGHDVTFVTSGKEAQEQLARAVFDVVVLDWMLPGMDGLSVLRGLRAASVDVPVLMLTARSDVASRIIALDAGADDHLAKPFDLRELLARVRALGRRRGAATSEGVVRIGRSTVDLATGRGEGLRGPFELDAASRAVLSLLVRCRGVPVPLDELARLADGDSTSVLERLRGHFEPAPARPEFVVADPAGVRLAA
jgi:two-component system phosphate regulon response regulator OmpR